MRRPDEERLWRLIARLHELQDAATRRQVRRMRDEYRGAVRLVLEMIADARAKR